MIAAALLLAQAAASAAIPPCRQERQQGGVATADTAPHGDCPWLPSRERIGIWLYEFEGSQFVENASSVAEARKVDWHSPRAAWFSFDAKSRFPAGCSPHLGQAYLIRFRGHDAAPRKNSGPLGGFGHMGAWSNEVLLDDATLVRDLGPLPGMQVRGLARDSGCR